MEVNLKSFMINLVKKEVTTKLNDTQVKVTELKTLTTERRALRAVDNILSFNSLAELYPDYGFPLKSIQLYHQFNEDLTHNKKDIKSKLVCGIIFFNL